MFKVVLRMVLEMGFIAFLHFSHKDVRQLSEPKINREECRENPVDPGVIEPKFLNTS
jgi:hypothetical protein